MGQTTFSIVKAKNNQTYLGVNVCFILIMQKGPRAETIYTMFCFQIVNRNDGKLIVFSLVTNKWELIIDNVVHKFISNVIFVYIPT